MHRSDAYRAACKSFWGAASLAATALLLAAAAHAADPVRGASLYANPARPGFLPCADCHAENPIVNNFGNIWSGRNAVALIQRAVQSNTGGMGVFQGVYGEAELADIAAYLGNAPNAIDFAATVVGATGAPRTVTISSSLKVGIDALKLAAEGDFAIAGTSCGSSVPRFSSCTVDVVFRPTALGSRSGALLIAHDGTPTPVRLPLAGTGQPPPAVAVVTPQRVDFGAAAMQRSVELANFSASPLRLLAIAVAPAQFAIAGGTCVPSLLLPTGGRCVVTLHAPARTGTEQRGTLAISHDGEGGGTAVELLATGGAVTMAALAADPRVLDFGTQAAGAAVPARMVNIVNAGTAPVTLADTAASESAFAIERSTCTAGTTLAPQQACQVAVGFRPAREGPLTAELRLGTTDPAQSLRIGLSAQVAASAVQAAPSRLAMQAEVGGGARAVVTVINPAATPLRLGTLRFSGPEAADFSLSGGDCRAGSTVLPAQNCMVEIAFAPRAPRASQARLRIEAETGVSAEVELRGSGTSEAAPDVWLDAAALDFGAVAAGASTTRYIGVHNLGSAELRWSQVAIVGSAADNFALGGDCLAGAALGPGAGCSVQLRYAPTGTSEHEASLVLWREDGATAAVIGLHGSSVEPAAATLAIDRLGIDFGRWPLRSPATVQRLTLRNTGAAALPAPEFSLDNPAFAIVTAASTCAAGLPPSAACTVEVAFRPPTEGSFQGTLRITAAGLAPITIVLAGDAAASAPLLAWQSASAAPSHGSALVGSSVAGPVWALANLGNAPSAPLRWVIDGPAASDFSLMPGATCESGRVLAAGASCTLRAGFHPQAAGERKARLVLASDGLDPVALEGRAVAPAIGNPQAMPAGVVFQARTNVAAGPQRAWLRNDGAAALAIDTLALEGAAFSFAPSAADACGGEPRVLLPGDECEITFAWDGSAAGALGGRLTATSATAFSAALPLLVREDPAQRTNVGAGGGGAVHWICLLGLIVFAASYRLYESGTFRRRLATSEKRG